MYQKEITGQHSALKHFEEWGRSILAWTFLFELRDCEFPQKTPHVEEHS